jgi:hypothetical protein
VKNLRSCLGRGDTTLDFTAMNEKNVGSRLTKVRDISGMSFRASWRDPRFREEARPGIHEFQRLLDSVFTGMSDFFNELLRRDTSRFSFSGFPSPIDPAQ